jgi:hypothetical protein
VNPEPMLPAEPQYHNGRPMMMDRDGEPMGLWAWSRAFEDTPGRTLKVDAVGDYEVRTCWLGVTGGDYLLGLSENPEIFGSIVCTREMPVDGMPLEDAVALIKRSTFGREILTGTEEEALAAHEMLLGELRKREDG